MHRHRLFPLLAFVSLILAYLNPSAVACDRSDDVIIAKAIAKVIAVPRIVLYHKIEGKVRAEPVSINIPRSVDGFKEKYPDCCRIGREPGDDFEPITADNTPPGDELKPVIVKFLAEYKDKDGSVRTTNVRRQLNVAVCANKVF